MRLLPFILTLCVLTGTAQAQSGISVNASADAIAPADQVLFKIRLNAEAATPQKAYELHQEREQVLVQQLKKHNIDEENIHFEPVSIQKRSGNDHAEGEHQQIQSEQNVTITLNNFDAYEEIQIALIKNGFNQFSGKFSSTDSKNAEDEALRKALEIAREKAKIIASQTGLTISGIKNINYSYNQRPPRPMQMEVRAQSSGSLIKEFDQSVSVSARVSVTYKSDQ